jgi:hypothetical protein
MNRAWNGRSSAAWRCQAHVEEQRFTNQIDIAVKARAGLPRAALAEAGFRETSPCSDKFEGFGVPVQFSDEQPLAEAVYRAQSIQLDDIELRVVSPLDLLRAKLRAAAEPTRRKRKALQDLADIESLLDRHPALEAELDGAERDLLRALPAAVAARPSQRGPSQP